MTSGPPTSCIRTVRGIGISSEKGLRRVTPLAMLREIETFGLLLFRRAQSRSHPDELEDQPGAQHAPPGGGGNAERLHCPLRADAGLHGETRAAQRRGG